MFFVVSREFSSRDFQIVLAHVQVQGWSIEGGSYSNFFGIMNIRLIHICCSRENRTKYKTERFLGGEVGIHTEEKRICWDLKFDQYLDRAEHSWTRYFRDQYFFSLKLGRHPSCKVFAHVWIFETWAAAQVSIWNLGGVQVWPDF